MVRRCDADFGLTADGDRIAVGLSGGKDSLALLYALAAYRRFCPNKYELCAVVSMPARARTFRRSIRSVKVWTCLCT